MLLPIIALFVIPLTSVKGVATPPNDKQALHRLDATLNPQSDKKAWFAKVERQLPPSQIPIWQRLQKQVPANSKHYAELSFILAYYGVDYDANLRHIARPYRLWQQYNQRGKDYRKYTKEYPGDPDADWISWGGTWYELNLLYLKRHDLKSLSAWLEQDLDTDPKEGSDTELGELWKRHKNDMLRAAYGSNARLNGLAEALTFDYVGDRNRQSECALLTQLSRLEHDNNPQVAFAARQVYGKIKAEADQWIHQVSGWKHKK